VGGQIGGFLAFIDVGPFFESADGVGRSRRRRSDAGRLRCTARDLELLRLVGEQYALSLPQLARLMGRSPHAARWLRSRWERAGWARGRALLVGEPVFVWLTRKGQRVAGSEFSLWRPNPGALAHIAAVTEVRLWVAQRHPESDWVCERELAREARIAGNSGQHRPDGLVVLGGRELAVEVELSHKRPARRERIMRELVARYRQAAYFAPDGPRQLLEQTARGVGDGRVQVFELPEGGGLSA
jgi:DNA-binding CsgD family transcriptional regulator